MMFRTVAELLEWLNCTPLLEPEQVEELRTLQPRLGGDATALLQGLLRREWLTEYQARTIQQGRGAHLILGPYVIESLLGEGGQGRVFKARHSLMNRTVALKVLHPGVLDQQ